MPEFPTFEKMGAAGWMSWPIAGLHTAGEKPVAAIKGGPKTYAAFKAGPGAPGAPVSDLEGALVADLVVCGGDLSAWRS